MKKFTHIEYDNRQIIRILIIFAIKFIIKLRHVDIYRH